jgi:hypothetical protein
VCGCCRVQKLLLAVDEQVCVVVEWQLIMETNSAAIHTVAHGGTTLAPNQGERRRNVLQLPKRPTGAAGPNVCAYYACMGVHTLKKFSKREHMLLRAASRWKSYFVTSRSSRH